MKQYRITSADILQSDDNDCYLSPDDPIHEFIKTSNIGGIGSENLLAKYMQASRPTITGSNKGKIAREQGIEPGTEDWFKHWFGNNK